MSIDSDAQKDLELAEEDAEGVAGGRKTKKTQHQAASAPRGPLMIKQTVTYGPTEISADSGDDDCAPDPSDTSDATT